MDILRFLTAGNVDDGKSTLIGRLLYDANALTDDQKAAILAASEKKGLLAGQLDFSLITDGLRDERQQGITIDVAYKYFSGPRRKFIIADTPGHVQYTRNMVTGASNCQLIILLVDARHGVTEQTRRHNYIAALLGIPHVVLCVNKMDLVGYSQERFEEIIMSYQKITSSVPPQQLTAIPVSALHGDNIVHRSSHMPWYEGKTLLEHLEEVHVAADLNYDLARFQVQYVIRPSEDSYQDYRAYAGQVKSGCFEVGDTVMVYPAGIITRIQAIELAKKPLTKVVAPFCVNFLLEDDIDIVRGDYIFKPEQMPNITNRLQANICWFDAKPLVPGMNYCLQHHSRKINCRVESILYKIDIESLQAVDADKLLMNDIAQVRLHLSEEICTDVYTQNRAMGSFILIDPVTHNTVAGGMIA